MIEKPYFVYDAFDPQDTTGQRRIIEVTHYPLLDLRVLSAQGYSSLSVVAGPMPLAWATHRADRLKRQLHLHAPGQSLFPRFLESLFHVLGRKGSATRFDVATVHDCRNVVLPTEEDLDTLAEILRGRILFQHEIRKALLERGLHIVGNLHDILQALILKGVIRRVPSVAVERFGIPSCRRCGNLNVVQASCASCSSERCFYCPECASMGQARACRPLYYSPGSSNTSTAYSRVSPGTSLAVTSGDLAIAKNTLPVIKPGDRDRRNFAVSLPFRLTPAQKHASQLVTDFLHDPAHNECLVFAVCGAGKTEVVFDAIAHVLRSGGKALFVIPRSDVVAEVVPRIGSAIPDARILELRSGVKSRYTDADIVVATTHQVLRFFEAFDLVVLDEVDAFPYRGSAILHYAVRRATAHCGNTVFMTATPDRELLRKVDMREVALVRISARHHGRPLPEPEIIQTRLPQPDETCQVAGNGLRLPDQVLAIIERSLRTGRRLFIFVPTVSLSRLACIGISTSLQVSGQPRQSRDNHDVRPTGTFPLVQKSSPARRPSSIGSPLPIGSVSSARNASSTGSVSPAGSVSSAGNVSPAGSLSPEGNVSLEESVSPERRLSQLKTPRIASIHAAHPNRDSHREAFRTGAIDIIVSTSVLERGITVENADVLVLYADYERVFDTATLTQMAGRAGRTKDDTQARVYFVARHVTASMRMAIQLIQDMNRHAAKSGYLQP